MIHFITNHYRTDFWVDPQLAFIYKNTNTDYKVYAYFTEVANANSHLGKFDFAAVSDPRFKEHHVQLDMLADMVTTFADSDDDLMVFIDSDALPIGDWEKKVRALLKTNKLVAIRMDEDNGDIRPNPAFTVTTVGFWKKIKGTWEPGFRWATPAGRSTTDIGGNLLEKLINEKVTWAPLLRSNKKNFHPVHFGIYGDIVYHHGSGSRKIVLTRYDKEKYRKEFKENGERHPGKQALNDIVAKTYIPISDKIKSDIIKNEEFYKQFL